MSVVRRGLLLVLGIGMFAVPCSSQSPSWSRGILEIPISFDDCKARARRALEAEGYAIANQGGDLNGDYHFGGNKDAHSAVISCNSGPGRNTWANFFVASRSNDGNVPGAERIKLQRQMAGAGSVTLVTGTYRVEASTGGDTHLSTWRLEVNGNQITGVSDWSCCPGARTDPVRGRIEGNRVTIQRECGDGCSQSYEGTIQGNFILGSFTGSGAVGAKWKLYLR